METVTTINGNGQPNVRPMPEIHILADGINSTALAHIEENTGLRFQKRAWGYSATPTKAVQIVALLLTYNFKTQYHDNGSTANTIFLKDDHHVGFKVDSICLECCKANGIPANGLASTDRLSC